MCPWDIVLFLIHPSVPYQPPLLNSQAQCGVLQRQMAGQVSSLKTQTAFVTFVDLRIIAAVLADLAVCSCPTLHVWNGVRGGSLCSDQPPKSPHMQGTHVLTSFPESTGFFLQILGLESIASDCSLHAWSFPLWVPVLVGQERWMKMVLFAL